MQTRSMTKMMPKGNMFDKTVYLNTRSRKNEPAIIDFDEASRAWNKNKQHVGCGCYIYIS